jgi:hypothetical protein
MELVWQVRDMLKKTNSFLIEGYQPPFLTDKQDE